MNAPTFEEAQEIIKRAQENYCSTCNKTYTFYGDIEFIKYVGMCRYCDHIQEEHDHLLSKFI